MNLHIPDTQHKKTLMVQKCPFQPHPLQLISVQGSPNNEIAQFLSKNEALVALISLFKSVFFSPIIILFLQYSCKSLKGAPMFLKFDPYRVWCSIFYSKLVNCILFKIIVQPVCFVKGRGTCGSGERNVKILIDFRKSPRFSLTSPLSQLREKSSRPVFTMCG